MGAADSKQMHEVFDIEPLLTPEDVARKLVVSEDTLTTWRCTRRQHIPFVKVGRLVRYRESDIAAFIAENLQTA